MAEDESLGKTIGIIEAEDVKSEVDYWSTAIVCYVLGANPPYAVMNGYFWGKLGLDKVLLMNNGCFLVRFQRKLGILF